MVSLDPQHSPGQSPDPVRSDPFAPGTAIARYRVISFIGSGAMGDVYRAHDRALDRDVALKVLPPELTSDRERVRRFAQEARAASALSHPHIVTIHEVGHARPTLSVRPIDDRRSPRRAEVHYIAMELIEGQTLREGLAGSLSTRRALELLTQVADGLGKAHGAGIIHRDLKPDNILVADEGYAKIVDFGLAKLTDTSWNPIGADSPTLRALTAHGELLGTPGYMAPEQIAGKAADTRADIFSFGCMLYEAIARVRPFEAETFIDTLYKIMHDEPAPLSLHVPDVSPELERIVTRCLAKDREVRYQSIRDVASDLRNAASPTTTAPARKPQRPSRNWKPALWLLAAVPLLAWLVLKATDVSPATAQTVQRMTSDGRAWVVTVSPDGRYVAYVTQSPKGQALVLEQVASGATLTVVPPVPMAHYAGIAFSRDGEQLYFTRYDNDTIATLQRVSILGGAPQSIVRDVDSRVAVSPDGKRLAFVRDDLNLSTSLLLVADPDGGNLQTLARFSFSDRLMLPVWSPDGTRLLAVQQSKLIEVSYPQGEIHTIEPRVAFESYRGVAWPSRNQVLVSATEEGGSRSRLWEIDPTNGKTNPLTSELTELVAPAMSTDGAIAALQVIRDANLFEAKVDGTMRPLTSGTGASNGLSGITMLDGRVIYVASADGRWDLWSLGEQESRRLTEDPAYEEAPASSPDRSAIYYLSSTSGTSTIWRMRPDGTERQAVTSGPHDGDFALSPDSQSIAFTSHDAKAKAWDLWIQPTAGGAKRRLARRSNILRDVRYSPDGKTLVFTGYDDSALRVYRVSAQGGPAQAVVKGRAQNASISPDGTTIACVGGLDGTSGPIRLVPTAGGPVRTLPTEGSLVRWKPDGSALAFLREGNLWLQPRDGGPPRKITSFDTGTITDYTWSADGTRVVIAHVTDAMDVVVIR